MVALDSLSIAIGVLAFGSAKTFIVRQLAVCDPPRAELHERRAPQPGLAMGHCCGEASSMDPT